MPMRRVVVVGGSIAAVTAADSLRTEGFEGTITVLSQETVAPYTRVPLSKGVLAGRESFDDIALPALSEDIDLRTGVRAEGLDLARRLVRTSAGPVEWDGLVIATGARARRLAPALDEVVIRDQSDCAALRGELAAAGTALVVGGGFLGMEIASTLNRLGTAATVIDREPPLRRLLGPTVATRVCQAAEEAGVRFLIEPGGAALVGHPGARPRGVQTADGRVLEADLVVSAAGDVPNVEWLAGSGLPVSGNGIRVDERNRVRPDVVAAGDVAASPVTGGGHARIPSWTNAVDQARAAARALIRGEDAPRYEPSYYFWTEQFGLDIKISGALVPDTELTVDNDWQTADAALLTWGDAAAPHRVLGWNHHLRPAQLKRMTRGADRVGTV